MKLVHVSDLHICSPEVEGSIRALGAEFSRRIARLKQLLRLSAEDTEEVHIEIMGRSRLEHLVNVIERLDPEAVLVTGDVTTFGDRSSFDFATPYLRRMRDRGPGRPQRKLIMTPGNHDVLCSHLASLLRRRGRDGWLRRRLSGRVIRRRVEELLSMEGVEPNPEEPMANYHRCFREAGATDAVRLANGRRSATVVTYNSVSDSPRLPNLGVLTYESFEAFRRRVQQLGEVRGALIVLMHHNPMSSPDELEGVVTNAFNGMPAASSLLYDLQMEGVDLVVYGHQHRLSCILLDFASIDQGHLYLVGTEAVADSKGQGGGFSVIELNGDYCASVSRWRLRPETGTLEPGPSPVALAFERKAVRDEMTIGARSEMRHFRERRDQEEWERILDPGARSLLLAGPRQKDLSVRDRVERLKDCLVGTEEFDPVDSVRVLVTDPRLFGYVLTLPEEAGQRLGRMWGGSDPRFEWKNQAKSALAMLQVLFELRDEIDDVASARLEVRLAQTLIPFGGRGRDWQAHDGILMIRLLPVSLFHRLERPTFRLERRHDKALFRFFQRYFSELWAEAQPFAGDFAEMKELEGLLRE